MGDNNVESDEVQVHTIRVEVKVPKEMFIVSNKSKHTRRTLSLICQ